MFENYNAKSGNPGPQLSYRCFQDNSPYSERTSGATGLKIYPFMRLVRILKDSVIFPICAVALVKRY